MKRRRTLSGIRATLDYKSLNVFGDIVGNFTGHKVPTVEDFNTALKSYDSCDNLRNLGPQSMSMTQSHPTEATSSMPSDKSRRGRRPKKRSYDEEPPPDPTGTGFSSSETSACMPNSVIGSIGNFFKRFCEKYPSDTAEYESFVKLARAYEGKGVNEATFYSRMREILEGDSSDLLDDFVNLIQPADSFELPSCEQPAHIADFPFTVDRKANKIFETEQVQQHQQQFLQRQQLQQLQLQIQQQQQQLQQQAHLSSTSTRPVALSTAEVSGIVKNAVTEKAKGFLLDAKNSMDPHTYISFLDIMVELRSLYKSNEIEDAIEKLDVAKGILTRVNPQLRVELDRYFPIVNANGGKHNLEHHTFEQSQRQYREWQRAQVAHNQMKEGSNAFSSLGPSSSTGEGAAGTVAGTGHPSWLQDIAQPWTNHAKVRDDQRLFSDYARDQVQTARRQAKENAMLKNNVGGPEDNKEDLLEASLMNFKGARKRTATVSKTAGVRAAAIKGIKAGLKEKNPKQAAKVISKSSENHLHFPEQGNQGGTGMTDFMNLIPHHPQHQQQHMHPMTPLPSMLLGPGNADTSSSSHSSSNSGSTPYSFPSTGTASSLPSHSTLAKNNGFHMAGMSPSLSTSSSSDHSRPTQKPQFSSYGAHVGGVPQLQEQQQHQHQQHQYQEIQRQQLQQKQQANVNYTPAFQAHSFTSSFPPSSILPAHSHVNSSTQQPLASIPSCLLKPYSSAPVPTLATSSVAPPVSAHAQPQSSLLSVAPQNSSSLPQSSISATGIAPPPVSLLPSQPQVSLSHSLQPTPSRQLSVEAPSMQSVEPETQSQPLLSQSQPLLSQSPVASAAALSSSAVVATPHQSVLESLPSMSVQNATYNTFSSPEHTPNGYVAAQSGGSAIDEVTTSSANVGREAN